MLTDDVRTIVDQAALKVTALRVAFVQMQEELGGSGLRNERVRSLPRPSFFPVFYLYLHIVGAPLSHGQRVPRLDYALYGVAEYRDNGPMQQKDP